MKSKAKKRTAGRGGKRKKKSGAKVILFCFAVLIAVCVFLFYTCQTERQAAGTEPRQPIPPEPPRLVEELDETIKIFTFNIQVFGQSKMAKPEVVKILVDIISQSDLTAVQEVRSVDPAPVRQFMDLLPPYYSYVLGPREGRSSSKEQYWIIYDSRKMEVKDSNTWDDPDDIFERNPLGVYVQTKGKFNFVLINNHIQPAAAGKEISAIPQIVDYFRGLWNERDILIVGDFNADGSYYNENFLESVFDAENYTIILTNEYDTTVGRNTYTYDRFIITKTAREDFTGNFGVIRFDELYDFSNLSIEPREVSDHYPVWAEFYLNRDTD
jgi:endonuclease/exonuclease/phosphatase family metal-dependent hydrolase